jgi:hypothetical protein
MLANCWLEVRDSHALLPHFLRRHSDINPEVLVAVQVDDHDCFMWPFVTIPRFQEICFKLCLPMLHLDGTHSKSTLHDGVTILVVAKLGNGTQLHLGSAHVPVESALHMVWIIPLLCLGDRAEVGGGGSSGLQQRALCKLRHLLATSVLIILRQNWHFRVRSRNTTSCNELENNQRGGRCWNGCRGPQSHQSRGC